MYHANMIPLLKFGCRRYENSTIFQVFKNKSKTVLKNKSIKNNLKIKKYIKLTGKYNSKA